MTADVTGSDILMAGLIIFGVFALIMCIIWSIGWIDLRRNDKLGPLAKAEQDHKIEAFHVASVLKGKNAEAEIALAEAKVIEAKAKVVEAQAKATELEMERLDRQLTRGNSHREAQ